MARRPSHEAQVRIWFKPGNPGPASQWLYKRDGTKRLEGNKDEACGGRPDGQEQLNEGDQRDQGKSTGLGGQGLLIGYFCLQPLPT